MASATRTEAVASFRKPVLEDRLDDEPDSLLDDAILDRWNAQRPRPAIAFRDVHPFGYGATIWVRQAAAIRMGCGGR